jgi:hypothetical protein
MTADGAAHPRGIRAVENSSLKLCLSVDLRRLSGLESEGRAKLGELDEAFLMRRADSY